MGATRGNSPPDKTSMCGILGSPTAFCLRSGLEERIDSEEESVELPGVFFLDVPAGDRTDRSAGTEYPEAVKIIR